MRVRDATPASTTWHPSPPALPPTRPRSGVTWPSPPRRRRPIRAPAARPAPRQLRPSVVRGCGRVVGVERCSCLHRLVGRGDVAESERLVGRRISKESRHAARRQEAPAGAKGWWRVSMCQIASVSLRDRSMWATLGPRWRPKAALGVLVALGVVGVFAGVQRGLEQRPAQDAWGRAWRSVRAGRWRRTA
jgi:hypothetical protein